MGKEKGARAAETDNSSRKALRLESTDSGCGDMASPQEDGSSYTRCKHFNFTTIEMYEFLKRIKPFKCDPECKDCKLEATTRELTLEESDSCFMMCLGCSQCFCAGSGTNEDGPMGHAWPHAHSSCHPVALWIDQPDAAYCFQCGHSLSLKMITLAARSHEFGYAVRGITKRWNKCYVNALVQCLLALYELWISMLGPHAPTGSLGVALKNLYLETRSGNNVGATLNPWNLLKSVEALNQRYGTLARQDSRELLLHLRDGLNEEEILKRPSDMRKDVPTVVDSTFQGQVSTTWTYKQCGHTSHKSEAFYELSLILQPKEHPTKSMISLTLPAKEYPTKIVASPQRRGKLSRADHKNQLRQLGEKASQQRTVRLNKAVLKNNLRQLGKALQQRNDRFFQKEEKKVDSISSIKECLEYCFRKDVVIKCCEICSAEKPSSNRSIDGGQMVGIISESTLVDMDQTVCDHHGKVEEKSDLLSTHDNQDIRMLNQDKRKQLELENSAHQVGEAPNKPRDMGGHTDKTVSLSKLPPVLTLHVPRFKENDKRMGHVKFEENLDVGEYMDPRSEDKDNGRYRLVGVIEHIGSSIEEGYHVAYVRGSRIVSEQKLSSSSSSWFYANDDDVREVSLDEVLTCEAFLLFYERIEG